MKPEFFQHEGLFDLEQETGWPMRVAFEGLWNASDREGRFEWRPRALKANILPYDQVDFSRVLDALWTRGFVVRYTSNGRHYGWIPSFRDHQAINNREQESELPDPEVSEVIEPSSTRAPRVDDARPTRHDPAQAERKGTEGNGTETTSPDGEVVGAPHDNGTRGVIDAVRNNLTADGRGAWDRLKARMRNPYGFAATLRATVDGLGGKPVGTWEAVSIALADLETTGDELRPILVREYVRKAQQTLDRPDPKTGSTWLEGT